MSQSQISHPLSFKDLAKPENRDFDVRFKGAELKAIANILSAVSVEKMRIFGKLSPSGAKDWDLKASVGASVTQTCVVTLEPVHTRIDVPVTLSYVADYKTGDEDSVTEMTANESIEPLGPEIDLALIAVEAVALALPDYPRAPNAQLETRVFTEPGITPMSDEDAKPFASLAQLRDKLSKESK